MNKKLLRSHMVLHDDNNIILAAALGITPQSFSAKVNETNGSEFTQSEMNTIRIRYKLSDAEFINIFFADLVSN